MKNILVRRIGSLILLVSISSFIFLIFDGCKSCSRDGDECTEPEIVKVDTQSVFNADGNSFKIKIKAKGKSCNGELLYSIENGREGTWQSESEFEDVKPGAYKIAVKDKNDKIARSPEAIIWEGFPEQQTDDDLTISSKALHAIIKNTNETCSGCNDGVIKITSDGGAPPYSYSIDKGKNFTKSNVFKKLKPGRYNVKVKDSKGKIYTHTLETIIEKVSPKIKKISKKSIEGSLNKIASKRDYDLMDSILTYFESDNIEVSGKIKSKQKYSIYMYLNRLMYDGPKGSIKLTVSAVGYNDRNKINAITINEK